MSEENTEGQILEMGFSSSLTVDQEVRLEVVKNLLRTGNHLARIEEADKIVSYILEGKKEPEPKSTIKKKLPVFLPGEEGTVPVQAQAYLKDDNTIEIEFREPRLLQEMWRLLDEDRVVNLSFGYFPSRPVDTSKDI